MIRGIGCDIVDLKRIDVTNDKLALKILTDLELEVYHSKQSMKQKREYLGGRFAGKEAFFKAVGIVDGHNRFSDVVILNDEQGKPYLNYQNSFISIAHENNYVVAYVIIEV